MKMLLFSDLHGDRAALERLMAVEADYYLSAGDLVSWASGFEKLGPVLAPKGDRVLVLPGNHESESNIERFCQTYSLCPLHGKSLEIAGVHLAGLGYSNPTPFNTPGEYGETEIAARLEPFHVLKPLVLVCHCPPLGTSLDEAMPGRHFGSSAVRSFIDRHQPVRFFCGHIHEAAGRETAIGATRGVNLGKQGYLLDFATL
jgi:hypothetical protein